MSSSAIGFQTLNKGLTGATGARGAQGPIGPTGGLGGPTGATGNLAPYILNVLLTGQTATIELSDGTEYLVSGNFLGATGSDTTIISIKDPLDPGSDAITASLLASGNNTNSFVMRGLCGFGSLVVSENATTIFIDSIYTPSSGSLDSFGLTNNTLVYLKQNNQLSSTTIGVTSGNFYDGVLNFEKSGSTPASPSFSKLLPRSKVKYLTPTYKTSTPQPVVLNIDDAGVFYVRTPNGISAFNGNFKNSEVASFTLITESDDIWNFPSNVYFENGENYLTCGKSILNLTSFDQGTSWYATVAARGIDASITNCQIRGVLGSCCYRGVTGTQCVDYVTKNQCDILSGTFNPLQPCETSCGSTFGVCCSNGQCIEDANYAECLAFGGKFLFGVTCGSFGASQDPTADNKFRLCYDKCQNQKVACCKDGVCLGDEFTKIECENILEGVAFVDKACSEVDCCEQNVKIGACCKNQQCSQKTLNECKADGGVFMGEGELCENINCKCINSPTYGYCCKCVNNTRECSVTLQENCSSGVWTADSSLNENSVCDANGASLCLATLPNCQPGTNIGSCCYCDTGKQATICEEMSQATCAALGGNFISGGSCQSTTCNPCTSDDGGPCSDCVIPVPGVCCKCDDPNNPCIETDDIKTCPSGYTPNTNITCADNPCGCNSGAICDIRDDFFSIDGCPPLDSNFTINNQHTINDSSSTFGNKITVKNHADASSGIEYTVNSGVLVKDFYVDITGPGFHVINEGKDLKFCFTVDLSKFKFLIDGNYTNDSLRIYILRTWYPKFYAQNYANFRNFSFVGDENNFGQAGVLTRIPARTDFNENSSAEDGRYWGYLAELDSDSGSTAIAIEQDLLNGYINKNQYYSYKHFKDQYEIPSSFTTDDLRKELNCPLYGLNTRGKGINDITSKNTVGAISNQTFLQALNFGANTNSNGNIYPLPESVDSPRYYHSTDIGIRYGGSISGSLSNLPDTMKYSENYGFIYNINSLPLGLTYISNGSPAVRSSLFLLYNKSVVTNYTISDTFKLYRFAGYNDFGINSNVNNSSKFNSISDIGYYQYHAILNNFSNVGGNLSGNTPFNAYGIGHPLTMDYDGDFIESCFGGNCTRVAQYSDSSIQESPIRYTKDSAIIFDSDVLTREGNSIFTIKQPESITADGTTPASFTHFYDSYGTKVYLGAINNPADVSNGRLQAQTVGKYLVKSGASEPSYSYNFCVTLPNYKDYIFTDENQSDQTEELINGIFGDLTKGRFTNFKNKLRFVVYTNVHEPTMVGNNYSKYHLFDSSDSDPKNIKNIVTDYIDRTKTQTITINEGFYSIKFNDPNLCTDQTENCELCSSYVNTDYESNFYCAIAGAGPYELSGTILCYKTTFDPATGLGSLEPPCCAGYPGFGSAAIISSCGNNTDCDCKGELRSRDTFGCCDISPCDSNQQKCNFNSNFIFLNNGQYIYNALLNSGFTFINFPTNGYEASYVRPPSIDGRRPQYDLFFPSGFLIKLKPYSINGKTYYSNFWELFNKDSFCNGAPPGECTRADSKNQSASISGKYLPCIGTDPSDRRPITPDGYDTINEPYTMFRSSNRCLSSNKSCNHGSESRDLDLQTVADNFFQGFSDFDEVSKRFYGFPDNYYTYKNIEGQVIFDCDGRPAKAPEALYEYSTEVIQGTCPTAFTSQFINKLIPTPDGESICVPLECSVINCSEYEDCNPS